jgi:hypothetical protein
VYPERTECVWGLSTYTPSPSGPKWLVRLTLTQVGFRRQFRGTRMLTALLA